MNKVSILVLGLVLMVQLNAQQVKLPVGKKFQMISEVKSNSNTSMMGQEMEVANASNVYIDYELKSVGENKFSLGMTVKRIRVNVSVMGQEQSIDSDDPATKSDPAFAEAFKSLNNETLVSVENGQVSSQGQMIESAKAMLGNTADITDIGRLFLQLKDENIKVGYNWTSSSSSGGSSSENNLSIEKITETEIEVSVNSKLKIATTMNQNGMEIKQQTEGNAKSTRIYNRSTGLLLSETTTTDIKGNMEVMAQQMPMSSKIETKTTIKLL
jgi:hypothetical protein